MIDVSKKLGNEIIGELQKNKDVGALITIVEKTNNPSDGRFAIWALGDLKAEIAVEPLIYALLSVSFQQTSVQALGNIGNEKAVKPLFLLLQNYNGEKTIREDILQSLGKIASKEAISIIISYLDSELGEKAFSVLAQLGNAAIQPLISALNGENKTKIVKILGEIGTKQAAKPLLAILETELTGKVIKDFHYDPTALREVVRAIVNIKDAEAMTKTVKMLIDATSPNPLGNDNDYAFQNNLIFALGDTQDKRVIRSLVGLLLEASENRVRYTAAWALATLGSKIDDPTVIQQLIGALEEDRKYEGVDIRDMIAWALIQTDENETAISLIRYIKDKFMETLKKTLFPESEMSM
jgi:HEAT repeat protein